MRTRAASHVLAPAGRLLASSFLLLASFLPACSGPAAAAPPRPDPALAADPCAARLQDISGAMLMYYLVNKKLPADLEQLRPFAEAGTELNFTCPVSGQPYRYIPLDPTVPVTERRLVLYDAIPAHHGLRWGIVADPSQSPTQPVTLWVVQLDEPKLHQLLQLPSAPLTPMNP